MINRIVPDMGTSDMAEWLIVIELCNSFAPESFAVALYPEEPEYKAPPQQIPPARG